MVLIGIIWVYIKGIYKAILIGVATIHEGPLRIGARALYKPPGNEVNLIRSSSITKPTIPKFMVSGL